MQPADLNSQLAIAGTNIILYIYLKEYKDIYIYKDRSEKNGFKKNLFFFLIDPYEQEGYNDNTYYNQCPYQNEFN